MKNISSVILFLHHNRLMKPAMSTLYTLRFWQPCTRRFLVIQANIFWQHKYCSRMLWPCFEEPPDTARIWLRTKKTYMYMCKEYAFCRKDRECHSYTSSKSEYPKYASNSMCGRRHSCICERSSGLASRTSVFFWICFASDGLSVHVASVGIHSERWKALKTNNNDKIAWAKMITDFENTAIRLVTEHKKKLQSVER